MRTQHWVILSVLPCLLLIVAAYVSATRLTGTLYAYRSPLHESPPPPRPPLGRPVARRVVFVLIDGLRLDTSLQANVMPFLGELRQQGARATMHSRPPSYSAPSYSVLLTGSWPDLSDGPAMNLSYEDIPTLTQDELISAVHRAGLAAAVSGFHWFEKLIPSESVAHSYYTAGEDRAADREVVNAALPWPGDPTVQFVLIHLDQLDYAGHHEGGPRDSRWDAAAGRVDGLLREIVATLDLTQDALLICSDHGHIGGGHGGPEDAVLVEPFVLVGSGVRAGEYGNVNMVDVAPTLAVLLGTSIPASSQGRVLADMLELTDAQVEAVESSMEPQQAQLLRHYEAAIGQHAEVRFGPNAVSAFQSALETARSQRLLRERLPRAALSLLVLLLPIGIMWKKRGRELIWLLAGAILYLALFNLRYAGLDGSVLPQAELEFLPEQIRCS